MTEKSDHIIVAATIGTIDLARTDPATASEIARLDDLMGQGQETREEFLRLCHLLHQAGAVEDAEHLLRRNLDTREDEAVYARLFGTTKPDDFEAALQRFEQQFEVRLEFANEHGFLDSTYHSAPRRQRINPAELLSTACEIRFTYAERRTIDADVGVLDDDPTGRFFDDYLVFQFVEGRWVLRKQA